MALSASRDTLTRSIRGKISIPLKANAKVYKGGMVGVDSTGYGVDGAASATAYQMVLIATADADNTGGSSGAISVDCYECDAYLANSGTSAVDQTCLGNAVFGEDDQTVAKTNETSTLSICGICTGFDSGGVWVRFAAGILL